MEIPSPKQKNKVQFDIEALVNLGKDKIFSLLH